MNETISPPTKKRVTKKDPEKIFLEKCKLYLSSCNSRQTPYAYFNIAPNTIILSNSTSPPAGKSEIIYGDRLMNQISSELGMHVVTFNDVEFYNQIIDKLNIPTGRDIYWIQINKALNALSNKIEFGKDAFGTTWLSTEDKPIGDYVSDIHVVASMLSIYNTFNTVGDLAHQQTHTHLLYSPGSNHYRLGKLFMADLCLTEFIKNSQLFEYASNRLRVPVIDGISTVDTKEFLKKINSQKIIFSHNFYIWARDAHSFSMVSLYSDETVSIRSIRPHLIIIPMLQNFIAETVTYYEDFKASQFLK